MKLISSDYLGGLLTGEIGQSDTDIYSHIETLTDSKSKLLIRKLASGTSEFNFTPGHPVGDRNIAYVDMVHDGAPENLKQAVIDLKAYLLAYCNPPAAELSEIQYNRQNNIYKAIPAQVGSLVLTLAQDLPEPCPVTFWDKEAGFSDVNLGKPITLFKAGKYRHNINTSINGSVEARMPYMDADLTIEAG